MRGIVLSAVFLAACGSTPSDGSRVVLPTADSKVRVVWNQYRGAATVFVMENEAGRDLVEMRSRKLQPGGTPVAYVPDDVMEKVLKELKRFDWERYAIPRPADPRSLGASGELTIIEQRGRRTSLLRVKSRSGYPSQEQIDAAKAYGQCTSTFLAVWNHFRPQMQATTSDKAFGVKRAGDGR